MTTIKLRRGTAAEWTAANPILAAGEMGIETDTRKFKFGDGTTPWNTLAYASAEGGGGTGDVTAAGDNYFTGNNTFTGTTKFDNDVNIHGANLEVAGMLEAATGNITNLQVPNTLTSSGEINAVSIKTTGLRSDDIQTTTNKKYLTEVDVDNQTIQVVDGKLHANLDTKQDILSDGNGTKIVDNKVDINQGNAGIQGLNLYQNNGTITKNNDLSITFNNGACGYIFLENKGANNDYEIILHQSYLGAHGPASDSSINGVRCLPQAVVPTPGEGAKGECWFDTFESPFRVVAIANNGPTQLRTVDTINYIKYVIKGTNLTISYSSTGETYSELYTIAISPTYVINVCIANSPWQNDIADKWTNTTLFPDSYILDKTTNTYLMKQGTTNEGVAVASSTQYGLVLPDNSTIVSNNGVISAVGGSGGGATINDSTTSTTSVWSSSKTNTEITTAVDAINSTKNDNIFDISKFTVVGNPTITDDGVASGFSNSNYLAIPFSVNTTSFKFNFNFTTSSIMTENYLFGGNNPSEKRISAYAGSYGLTVNIYKLDGTRTNIATNLHGSLNINTVYSGYIEYDGNKYTVGLKTQDESRYTVRETISDFISDLDNIYVKPFASGNSDFSIDLKQFSITVDGKEVFNGLMNSTKPIYDKITSTNTTLSTFQTDTDNNFSAVNSALNEKANLSDLANYVPLATYNALLTRVEALETRINGGN